MCDILFIDHCVVDCAVLHIIEAQLSLEENRIKIYINFNFTRRSDTKI